MKVHLIRTPEYEREHLEDVFEFLNGFKGPIEFVYDPFKFNESQFPFLARYGQQWRPRNTDPFSINELDPNREFPLSWRELFSICSFYRNTFSIEPGDLVILLTQRKNSLNFFSIFDESRNAFIQTSEWDLFTKADSKYPIAYEVVSNILRILMKLPLDLPNDWIHEEPLGCLNDFCQAKKEIILKLRTGDICNTCLSRMQSENVDTEVIDQSLNIFEEIRKQLLFKHGFVRNFQPKPVRVDEKGNIYVGEKKIKLNPLESTLFIFFLRKADGVTLNQLELHREELCSIYRTIRPAGDESTIDELIRPYHQNGTFSVVKTRLNGSLRHQLGESAARFYSIERANGRTFKINLNSEIIVDIRY